MLELDEIFYNALTADSEIASATGGRIFSTCVEVPPMENDNTPLPYIVIVDEGLDHEGQYLGERRRPRAGISDDLGR